MSSHSPTALIIGASRGLGLLLAQELAGRGWSVIATTRGPSGAAASQSAGQIENATVDMTDDESLTALRDHLAGRQLDLLFVNGATNRSSGSVAEASTDEFVEVMTANALAPLRTLEALRDLVAPRGTVAVMSSEQGSISRNDEEGFEVYKASKAALNQLVRSYANRYADDGHTKLLIDPGHNRTGLGGDDAPFDPADSMSLVATVIEDTRGRGGLAFLDRDAEVVPW